MNQQVLTRMQSAGPKKILACDGGGILGLMSVEILLPAIRSPAVPFVIG